MDSELQYISKIIKGAKNPEEIFGVLAGTNGDKLANGQKAYQRLAHRTHPDHYTAKEDIALALECFKSLNEFWEKAQTKIKANTYGDLTQPAENIAPTVIVSNKNEYVLGNLCAAGTISDIYYSTFPRGGLFETKALLKISRSPRNNEFLVNEVNNIEAVRKDNTSELLPLIPKVLDSFSVIDSNTNITKQINVFPYNPKLIVLTDVIKAYPNGIDIRDAVWMYKRILAAISLLSSRNIVHGAILPPHILLNLDTHGIVLIDWCLSVADNKTPIKAIDSEYEEYYPKEVFAKVKPTSAIDIFMATTTIIKVLGGEVKSKTLPATIPKDIRLFFKSCTLDYSKTDNALDLHKEFDELVRSNFGEPMFRNFRLP